ncbi:Ku protein [Streptomyces armeniacus]|uniref:Non-homologous end joining protein Ku n=1 Tax=Streptomyces armeniacus TaxID=83291 RepID=A0A345XTQ1_9ACTN|nr:Ku protein [Streptomyces armeniacus]AXK35017.1 Ku protein [Streptomyces armeniacus]
MARAIWSGVVTFGLVSVPVQLFTATEDHTVHFRQFQRGTTDRVRNKRVNERTGKEVGYDDIVKGYDLGGGEYVMVEPGELDDIAPGKSQVIEISSFVDLDAVEPVFFDRTYYLAPQGDENTKVYELLRAALAKENKTGIATFVMRSKQYLVALSAQEDLLVLHTLHWADEVRDPYRELPVLPEDGETTGRELDTARQLIDTLSGEWRPEDYRDTYEERVRELVDAKAKGETVVTEEEPPEPTNVVDLMDALQRSVDESRGGRGGRGGGRKGASRTKAGRKRSSRTKASGTKASGSGGRSSGKARFEGLNKSELYEEASRHDISGRSRMTRDQLVRALAKEAS